jgi:hypothetical protein
MRTAIPRGGTHFENDCQRFDSRIGCFFREQYLECPPRFLKDMFIFGADATVWKWTSRQPIFRDRNQGADRLAYFISGHVVLSRDKIL